MGQREFNAASPPELKATTICPTAPLTFAELDLHESRRGSFAISFTMQVIAVALLLRLAAYSPRIVPITPHESISLELPELEVPPVKAARQPQLTPKLSAVAKIKPPRVVAKDELPEAMAAPVAPTPKRELRIASAPTPLPTLAKPTVKTDVFAGSHVAKSSTTTEAAKVQTGGFGDPNGVRGESTLDAKLNAVKLGGLIDAGGQGNGNGTAKSHGQPGVIANAGFGSGVAAGVSGNGKGATAVQNSGFGGAHVTTPVTGGIPRVVAPLTTPVEIIDKPLPVYTAEARHLKIEGEVLLKVIFLADGHVKVSEVIRGLGHGLDESAASAAQKIRFKPAQREQRPCDATATVHILFQLAG